ncbi:Rho GTPase-activating protein 35 [Holothuria leucospilota]|uniref:Rho GTPase-activating protein 35 n=1 Tax=Holothuria leucospilota TaxID=206669 RepID=A0A9Q1CU15_HOLLE|nr:Rho GTPase-activating protein 35 [Holothuria leucospilota]
MASSKSERIFHVAVVGMSGTTDTRGDFGVGKSCLCNRFTTTHEDDYQPQHNSTISASDFGGRIINNDHFLYWGDRVKRFDGTDFHFRIIEQTEFIDDMSFSILKGSNSKNYFKRCADTKLSSAEKVAYICPDQLGDELSFPQDILPGGKFQVEGYLLVFDVSNVKGRSVTKQREFVQKLYSSISKTKKPIVLVATKFDVAEDMSLNEVKQFAREKKLTLIECSSQKGVNINLPFCTLASLIDKNRSRPRDMTYKEGLRRREEKISSAQMKYMQLLDARVTDYHSVWSSTKADLEKTEDYQAYVMLAGTPQAKKHFRNHTKKLKEIHQSKKLEQYLSNMPAMLADTYPDLVTINERYWPACRDALPKHPHFEEWFITLNEPWEDSEYIDTGGVKIPFQLMTESKYSARVESYFQEHVQRLQEVKRKERYKSDFRTMLGTLKDTILPGSNFHEMRLHLEPFQCYQMLEEQERMAVFITHQNEIFQQAKEELLELLIERTDLFIKLDKGGKVLEQVNMLQDELSSDQRFTRLVKFPSERYVMIIKQFAFMHNLVTNSCFLHKQERCIENQIQDFVGTKLQRCNTLTVNILLLGTDGLAVDLAKEIKEMSKGGFQLNGSPVEINTEILDQKALTTDIHQRRDFDFDGCICVFTSLQSFEYIKTTLELTKISEGEDGPKVLSNIPVTLMFGRDSSIPESDSALRDEVQALAERIPDSTIVDFPEESVSPGKKFFPGQITSSVQSLSDMSTFRVAVVMMCGDPYSPETTLAYLMKNHTCHHKSTCEFCVTMEMMVDGQRQKMEVEVVSYHQAQLNCKIMHHAYILCYSPRRKASLETMKNFEPKTSGIPTLIVAVSDDGRSSSELVKEGKDLADQSESRDFMQGRANFMQYSVMMHNSQFLKQAFRKKKETEKIHQDLFFTECMTPYSDDDDMSDSTPDNELDDSGFELVNTSDGGSQGSSASRDDITSVTEASSVGEGDGGKKKKLQRQQRIIGRKLGEKQKEEKFLQSLEQLMETALLVSLSPDAVAQGQTTADSGKSPSKQPTNDEPPRKWWFKARKPKGFLKGLAVEELPFRPGDEVPLFVEQCVATIEEKGLTIEGIYRKPGKAAVVEDVITKVDKDPNFDITQMSINVHAFASSFKQYFHALSGPFIAYKTQTDLIKKFNDLHKDEFLIHLKSCIENLSPRRYNLLKYVLLHLKRIIDHSDENKMHTDNVSICWWPCLLHPQSKSVKDLTNEAKLASIFTLLLENIEMILDLEVDMAEEAMEGEATEEGGDLGQEGGELSQERGEMVEEKEDEVVPNEA